MDWKCPACGQTFKRARQAHKCFTGGGPELAFTGSKAKWLPLYMELLEAARATMRFDCVYPPSGGVLWRRRSTFALMSPDTRGLRVGFHSNQRLDAIEGAEVYPMSANRLLHAVRLDGRERIGEIIGYINASYMITDQEGQ